MLEVLGHKKQILNPTKHQDDDDIIDKIYLYVQSMDLYVWPKAL